MNQHALNVFPNFSNACSFKWTNTLSSLKVDLTAYVEKHEFCFDAVLDEHVTNDEVISILIVFK